jgi:hypothetical protein
MTKNSTWAAPRNPACRKLWIAAVISGTCAAAHAHVLIGKNSDAATIAPVRNHFMNAQDRARVDRDCEEVFPMENAILSPRQQIRLHLRCLVREHKFDKLGWHLKGIRRALFLSDFADRDHRPPRTFSVPLGSNTPSRFVRQLTRIN